MHCLPSRLKSTFFEKISSGGSLKRRGPGVKKKFQKTFILVFEVIVQPTKHIFNSPKGFGQKWPIMVYDSE